MRRRHVVITVSLVLVALLVVVVAAWALRWVRPPEAQSVRDPTSGGYLTPRTKRVLDEVRAAGFTHHVACWREDTGGEHPKGRACDFSVRADGFFPGTRTYTPGEKAYGDGLLAWLVANADRLDIDYVIWDYHIWDDVRCWNICKERYPQAWNDGRPKRIPDEVISNVAHTNHVHVSVM